LKDYKIARFGNVIDTAFMGFNTNFLLNYCYAITGLTYFLGTPSFRTCPAFSGIPLSGDFGI